MPALSEPRVVVVDHHDSYTWNLVHLVAAVTGELPAVVQHDEVMPADLRGFSHLVLSPGPGRPDDSGDFSLGRAVFELGLPVLGVCLGMQALVTAYGGRVERIDPAHGEVALVTHDLDGIFDGVPDPFEAVRYHSLAAVDLGPVLLPTAVDERSGVVMAVRHPALPHVGVQFHPESVLSQHGARLVANFLGGHRG
jgi:anthranilate synthase/aminodeoxychorismate synthase-like glutamine amidotransferase